MFQETRRGLWLVENQLKATYDQIEASKAQIISQSAGPIRPPDP